MQPGPDPRGPAAQFDRYLKGLATGDWDGAEHERPLSEGTATAGHASGKVTIDLYGHPWPDSDGSTRAAVDKVWRPASLRFPASWGLSRG